MKIDDKWKPCRSVRLTKDEAKDTMRYGWKKHCPDDKFRVTRYVREEKK